MVLHSRVRWHLLRWWLTIVAVATAAATAGAVDLLLPNRTDSVKFAVVGDFGTGDRLEYEVAAQMAIARAQFPFATVLTTGDNMVGLQDSRVEFEEKFERPFAPLLQARVRFFATLGNHDRSANTGYVPFNMNGARYYTFAEQNVRFFALDSNRPDRQELAWMNEALGRSSEEWKICYFHHPIYSDGERHGADIELRVLFEPLFTRYGVDVVFSGHEHVYERMAPIAGTVYFVTGSGGQELRELRSGAKPAASFTRDASFMLVEVIGSVLYFRTVSRTGAVVDADVIRRPGRKAQS
ncbi:MAG TPA: metallophosphoesterase [Rhodanobacteraceae bacterium]